MKKIPVLTILFLLAFSILLNSCNSDTNTGELPNLIIIYIDDMGYGDLSCYGNKKISTPNMDRIAEKGIRFTNFYVNSPICSPSRVALNTGRYPMQYKIHSYIASARQNEERAMNNFLDPTAMTIAKTLKSNGYTTGHFGKWHMGGGRDLGEVPYPSAYGFDKSLVSFEGIGDRVLFPGDFLCDQSAELENGDIIWAPKHKSTSIYVDSALAFIEQAGEKPFYLHLFPNDVHDPHLPDPAQLVKFKDLSNNPWEQKFFAVLEALDNQIGRFLNELEKNGKLDNTIVILSSDNGPTDWPSYYEANNYPENYNGSLYAPGSTGSLYGRKWSLYEGGIREPMIIMWNGHIPEGKTDNQTIISAIDLFPSLLSLMGLSYPDNLDGTNKSDAFRGTPVINSEPIMWEYASNPGGSILPGNPSYISPNLAIRSGDYKLLINADSTSAELFNLANDPGEVHNLIEKEPALARELAVKILRWRRSMPVVIPDK